MSSPCDTERGVKSEQLVALQRPKYTCSTENGSFYNMSQFSPHAKNSHVVNPAS